MVFLEEIRLQYLLIAGAFVLFGLILWLIKKQKMEVKYSIIWLAFSFVMIVFAICPYLVFIFSDIVRIIDPVNFIFMVQIVFILLILLSVSAVISGFSRKIKRLAQTNALLEKRVRRLEEQLNKKEGE